MTPTPDMIEKIRAEYESGYSVSALNRKYPVYAGMIEDILRWSSED